MKHTKFFAVQRKLAQQIAKKAKHLERYKASEIPVKPRMNTLVVWGFWAWLDFYDNGKCILTTDREFQPYVTPGKKPTRLEEVNPLIRVDFMESGGVQNLVMDYKISNNIITIVNFDEAATNPMRLNITNLTIYGADLFYEKRQNRNEQRPWCDTMFSYYFPKFRKTSLSDNNKTDALKVLPKKVKNNEPIPEDYFDDDFGGLDFMDTFGDEIEVKFDSTFHNANTKFLDIKTDNTRFDKMWKKAMKKFPTKCPKHKRVKDYSVAVLRNWEVSSRYIKKNDTWADKREDGYMLKQKAVTMYQFHNINLNEESRNNLWLTNVPSPRNSQAKLMYCEMLRYSMERVCVSGTCPDIKDYIIRNDELIVTQLRLKKNQAFAHLKDNAWRKVECDPRLSDLTTVGAEFDNYVHQATYKLQPNGDYKFTDIKMLNTGKSFKHSNIGAIYKKKL